MLGLLGPETIQWVSTEPNLNRISIAVSTVNSELGRSIQQGMETVPRNHKRSRLKLRSFDNYL